MCNPPPRLGRFSHVAESALNAVAYAATAASDSVGAYISLLTKETIRIAHDLFLDAVSKNLPSTPWARSYANTRTNAHTNVVVVRSSLDGTCDSSKSQSKYLQLVDVLDSDADSDHNEGHHMVRSKRNLINTTKPRKKKRKRSTKRRRRAVMPHQTRDDAYRKKYRGTSFDDTKHTVLPHELRAAYKERRIKRCVHRRARCKWRALHTIQTYVQYGTTILTLFFLSSDLFVMHVCLHFCYHGVPPKCATHNV